MALSGLLHVLTLSSAAQVATTHEEIEQHRKALRERERQTERLYLAEKGVLEEADDLHEYIRARILDTASSSIREVEEHRAELLSWHFARLGWTRDDFESLEAKGFDALGFRMGNKPASGMVDAELVIVGKIIGAEESLVPLDGYRSSIIVEVEDVLKGEAAADTITIRQLSGRTSEGHRYNISSDLIPETNSRYIFLLSNTLYQYYVANPDGAAEENIDESSALLAEDRYLRQYVDFACTDDGDLYSPIYGRLQTASTLGLLHAIATLIADR